MTRRTVAAFFGDSKIIDSVYAQGRREAIAGMTDLCPEVITLENFDRHADFLSNVEVIFTSWYMPGLTPEHLDRLPALKVLFYAAGTVRNLAGPYLERGITVVSAWQANAVPVAEFTQAQIILAAKGYFRNTLGFSSPGYYETGFRGRGNFGGKVALLGAGAIGRKVIELLRPFNLSILVFDPFMPPHLAREMGVRLVSLEQAFSEAYVVSNHLADLPETRHMLGRQLFEGMRPDATFINTGRGWTVDEEGMIEVLKLRPDLTALLDVTQVEPPAEGSLLYTLPNIHLSTHIAGSIHDELVRMADYCIQEFRSWLRGEPLRYAVSEQMLKTMA